MKSYGLVLQHSYTKDGFPRFSEEKECNNIYRLSPNLEISIHRKVRSLFIYALHTLLSISKIQNRFGTSVSEETCRVCGNNEFYWGNSNSVLHSLLQETIRMLLSVDTYISLLKYSVTPQLPFPLSSYRPDTIRLQERHRFSSGGPGRFEEPGYF